MASLDDILTTQKNGVVAINNLAQRLTVAIGPTGPTGLAAGLFWTSAAE